MKHTGLLQGETVVGTCIYTYWKIIDSSHLCQERDGLSTLLLENLVTWCSLEESVAFRI